MPRPFSDPTEPASGSWLERWTRRRSPHPLVFTCGVRVVAGDVPGERTRWRYRDSAIDRLETPGLVVLQHGGGRAGVTLHLERAVHEPGVRTRPGHVVLAATDATTGATVQVSVRPGQAVSFGVELI